MSLALEDASRNTDSPIWLSVRTACPRNPMRSSNQASACDWSSPCHQVSRVSDGLPASTRAPVQRHLGDEPVSHLQPREGEQQQEGSDQE